MNKMFLTNFIRKFSKNVMYPRQFRYPSTIDLNLPKGI